MERVGITVSRRGDYEPGDAVVVYGSDRLGVLDLSRPVTVHPLLFWPGVAALAGHLLDGHLVHPHLTAVRETAGHLEEVHLLAGHLEPADGVTFISEPHCFGRFRFRIGVVDGAGNEQTDVQLDQERVINSSPEAPDRFMPVEQQVGDGLMVFSFRPVALVG